MPTNSAPSNLGSLFEMTDTEAVETKAQNIEVAVNTPDFKIYFCKFCKKQNLEGRFTLSQHLCECLGHENRHPRNNYEEKVYQHERRRRDTAITAMIRKVMIEAGENISKDREECPFNMWVCAGVYEGVKHMPVLHMLYKHTKEDMVRELSKEELQRFTAMYKLALPRLEYFFKLTT